MLAAAPLTLAALPSFAYAEPAPAPLAPSAWPEPSPLASAHTGRLL